MMSPLSSNLYYLQIKKQSISKYGFTDTNPINYLLVCSTGFYIDSKGNNISTPSEVDVRTRPETLGTKI